MEENQSKKRLYGSLGWVIVGIYLILNAAVFAYRMPLGALIITIPINVILICLWFFIRFLYNKANHSIQFSKYISEKAPEPPKVKYGEGNGVGYVPNLTVDTDIFRSIDTENNATATFDITLKDYIKPKHVIIFHDEIDYGAIKKVEVATISKSEEGIKATFIKPSISK